MGLKDKAKNKAKEIINKAEERSEKIEGKAHEIAGKLGNDPQHEAEGKEKQANAEAKHDAKEIKD